MNKLDIIKGDITQIKADAIVNAANTSLLGGGGVDGAIHRSAGPQLLEECKTLNGCPTGEAKITNGYNLPAKYVIHTVGPIWHGGNANEEQLLANCYKNSLKVAEEKNFKTIAFPSISTGVYRFPLDKASKIAIKTILEHLKNSKIEKVTMVCFDENTYSYYKNALEENK
ncbi:O-acetyl-ADP-ribose deacetylase [Candidatus Margulisiibacteriota bacterium]